MTATRGIDPLAWMADVPQAVTAVMGGVSVPFLPAHRERQADAVLVTVSVPIPLSFDDLVAALYAWGDCYQATELADDRRVRLLVTDSAVNVGLDRLVAARAEMALVDRVGSAGGNEWEWLAFCRRRVTEVFGAAMPTQRPVAVSA